MRKVLILAVLLMVAQVSPAFKVDKAAKRENSEAQAAAMQKIRRIYVMDPHRFGYVAPAHLKKGIAKSDCLTLEPDPVRADAVLAPVTYESWLDAIGNDHASLIQCTGGQCTGSQISVGHGSIEWVLLDPKTGKPISDWTMKAFPSARKIEEAVGCH